MTASQRGGTVKSFILFLVSLFVLAVSALAVGGYFAWREASRPGPLASEAVVLLKPGASVRAMGRLLGDAGAVRYPDLFVAAVRLKGAQSKLKAGEYAIPANASVLDIIDILIDGKSILHYLTAPEGLTSAQILKVVAANEVLLGDITIDPPEGELLPETYAFTRGETRDEMIRDMMKAQDAVIDELWPQRAMELPFAAPEDAIILASIVEKETGIAEERPRIAAVFVNRLKKRMRLQSDPTVIYGISGGKPLGRGLRVSELERETPYNTYKIYGLPPTPIANPGRASIEAVLNPADTNDLYFVADGSGGHVFSSTLAEHNRNVIKWRRIEKEKKEG
ncbi:MAG: endolytic transglycosylase MltG [Parvularculaceae bacterium]